MGFRYRDTDELGHTQLKEKQRGLRDGFDLSLGLRVHRALSWYGRAEQEREDDDTRFILLWIGFNALYAKEIEEGSEREQFREFFAELIRMDAKHRIYDAVWRRFSQEIRLLMDNRYVFSPFWKFQAGVPGYDDWEERFMRSGRAIGAALSNHATDQILSILFDRLYMLRNQLMHGGATWNSDANRAQVRDGGAILGCLFPIFVDLIMDHPDEPWDMPQFPVVK